MYVLHRFDVSGVHPKNKKPGTFTEIPYDKKSVEDLVSRMYSTCLLAFQDHCSFV